MKNLDELKKAFFDYGRTYWEKSTYLYYHRNLNFFFNFLEEHFQKPLSDIDLSELTKTAVNTYIIYLRMKTKDNGKPIKSNTVRTYMRAVKTFLNYGYDFGHLKENLTHKLKLPKADDCQIVPLSNDEVIEIDKLFSYSYSDTRNKLIFHLMLDCGLRSMEVCKLRICDINLTLNYIVIQNSKGKKSRIIPIGTELAFNIRNYLETFKPHTYLFNKVNSISPINSNCLRALFRTLKYYSDIKRLHPHLLRHTFATSYIMGGGDLESLRLLLGHFDYAVTKQYLHLASQFGILSYDIYRLDKSLFKKAY